MNYCAIFKHLGKIWLGNVLKDLMPNNNLKGKANISIDLSIVSMYTCEGNNYVKPKNIKPQF